MKGGDVSRRKDGVLSFKSGAEKDGIGENELFFEIS
jgi:hypothetical protein